MIGYLFAMDLPLTVAIIDYLCDPGSIPVLVVSCRLSLLLVLALLREFFFGIITVNVNIVEEQRRVKGYDRSKVSTI